jgi:predicted lipid-binding transport protein (Tim44 family)
MPVDIIVLAAIAVFILLRLYGVLGQQIGNEKPSLQDSSFDKDSKVIELAPKLPEKLQVEDEGEYDDEIQHGLKEIRQADKAFRVQHFLEGAKTAFEMIMEALAKDDRDTLQLLLSPELFTECVAALKRRAQQEEYEETTLVSILEVTILAASLQGNDAIIKVKFVSEQVQVNRTKQGEKVENSASEIEVVEDSWVLKRDVQSTNPNWVIIETS